MKRLTGLLLPVALRGLAACTPSEAAPDTSYTPTTTSDAEYARQWMADCIHDELVYGDDMTEARLYCDQTWLELNNPRGGD